MAQIFRWFSPVRLVSPKSRAAVGCPRFGFSRTTVLPVGILTVLALALSACGGAAVSTEPNPNDFAFTLYQGQEELGAESLNFSDLQGKPVVLNFWAGLCPPCRAEMPEFQEFYEDYNDRVVLHISFSASCNTSKHSLAIPAGDCTASLNPI